MKSIPQGVSNCSRRTSSVPFTEDKRINYPVASSTSGAQGTLSEDCISSRKLSFHGLTHFLRARGVDMV